MNQAAASPGRMAVTGRLSVAAPLLAGLLAAPAAASQDRSAANEKGSLLIYPRVEVRWENVAPYDVIQDTFLHLTNDYPDAVDVKLFFVNGDAPIALPARWEGDPQRLLEDLVGEGGEGLRELIGHDLRQGDGGDGDDRDHPGWNFFDNVITLTANEPCYWAASTGGPKGVGPWDTLDPAPEGSGPGRPDPLDGTQRYLRGYVLAFAVQQAPAWDEIRWNHLAGDAAIVNYREGHAWQYNAQSFQVNAAVDHGKPTGSAGLLAMGTEYAAPPTQLHLNFIASESEAYSGDGFAAAVHDTDLTLLPIAFDFRADTTDPRTTTATFDIWNENEVKFTNLAQCITCWSGLLLSQHAIPNHFLIDTLHTNAGRARIDGVASGLCLPATAMETALLGVAAKLISPYGASGSNLVGLGTESGDLLYDVPSPPPESSWAPTDVRSPSRVR